MIDSKKVRVVVKYEEGKKPIIEVNTCKMEDTEGIEGVPVSQWFQPSGNRFAWKGLIKEIYDFLGEDRVSLCFEFNGPEEDRAVFKEKLEQNGIDPEIYLSKEEISKTSLERAKKAHNKGDFKEELRQYTIAAVDAGDAEAQFITGGLYYSVFEGTRTLEGVGQEEALSRTTEYYRMAAKQEHVEAQVELYSILDNNEALRTDENEHVLWLSKAASNGHPEMQFKYGEYLFNDNQYERAIFFLEGAINNKIVPEKEKVACFLLSIMFLEPETQDREKAYNYLVQSAEQGYDKAQYELGKSWNNGNGVVTVENKEAAAGWYERAAEQGHAEAQYEIGHCYFYGYGVEENKKIAAQWYTKAAEQDQRDGQYMLGECYYCGHGVEKNEEAAAQWYTKAAEQDQRNGQYKLGECYYYGHGVEKNEEAAAQWYTKAAEQDQRDGQYMLGECYYYGHGVEKNREAAVQWYTKAAEKKQYEAVEKLGECYLKAEGVAQSYETAAKLFEEVINASENDVKTVLKAKALNCLGACYKQGFSNSNKAFELYSESAKLGNVGAMNNVGDCYEKGYGTGKSLLLAKQWYQKSMEEGSKAGENGFHRVIEEYARSLYTTPIKNFYVAGNIPELTLKNAEKRITNNSERIIFLYDLVFREKNTGKSGFIVTSTKIKDTIWGLTDSYRISNIKEVTVKENKIGADLFILLNNGKERKIGTVSMPLSCYMQMCSILNKMIEFLKG